MIIVGIFVVFVFLGLAVILIDVAMLSLTGRKVQNVSDAVALAVVSKLDGSQDGWIKSKRAGFLALRGNSIFRANSSFQNGDEFGVIENPAPSGSEYDATRYTIGSLELAVDRGYYFSTDGGVSYSFQSLETPDLTTTVVASVHGETCPCLVWEVANAARVKITVRELDSYFTGVFGVGGAFTTSSRVAISARSDFVTAATSSGGG